MAKYPSMKRQVQRAFNSINKIGHSKRSDKLVNKTADGVYSYKYMKSCIESSVEFGKWVRKEHGVKYLKDITEEQFKEYMMFKKVSGASVGHLINIESHLRKLQNGVNKAFKTDDNFVTDKRIFKTEDKEVPKNRSITKKEFEEVRNAVSKNVREVIDMQYHLGLRIKEACNIRVEHIVKGERGYSVIINDGRGITKGGRSRFIPVPKGFEGRLEEIIRDKEPSERIARVKEDSVYKGLKRQEKRTGIKVDGSHSFRHSYARNRFKELLGRDYEKGQTIIKQRSTNPDGRLHATPDVGRYDVAFQNKVISVMDKIHSELGHGKGRWDLAEVYLKE